MKTIRQLALRTRQVVGAPLGKFALYAALVPLAFVTLIYPFRAPHITTADICERSVREDWSKAHPSGESITQQRESDIQMWTDRCITTMETNLEARRAWLDAHTQLAFRASLRASLGWQPWSPGSYAPFSCPAPKGWTAVRCLTGDAPGKSQ